MSLATPVAILGFTPFERSTFEAFLQLAARRTPAYLLEDDPFEADFVIVDADNPVLVQRVQAAGLLQRSVMLGATGHPDAALHRVRPFNLMQMVRALDALPRRVHAPQPAAAGSSPAAGPICGAALGPIRAPSPGRFAPRAAIQIPVPSAPLSLAPAATNPSRSLQIDQAHP